MLFTRIARKLREIRRFLRIFAVFSVPEEDFSHNKSQDLSSLCNFSRKTRGKFENLFNFFIKHNKFPMNPLSFPSFPAEIPDFSPCITPNNAISLRIPLSFTPLASNQRSLSLIETPFRRSPLFSQPSSPTPAKLSRVSDPSQEICEKSAENRLKTTSPSISEQWSPISVSVFREEREKHAKKPANPWKTEEDKLLRQAVERLGAKNWKKICEHVPGRTASQCSQRWRRVQPCKLRQAWSLKEDKQVLELVERFGHNWGIISSFIEGRTGKQIRERWLNKLDPAIDRSRFTKREDKLILKLFLAMGAKWKEISKELQGRSENMVKNRFYSAIRKELLEKQPQLYRQIFEKSEKTLENEEEKQEIQEKRSHEDAKKQWETEESCERLDFLVKKEKVLEGLVKKVIKKIEEVEVESLKK